MRCFAREEVLKGYKEEREREREGPREGGGGEEEDVRARRSRSVQSNPAALTSLAFIPFSIMFLFFSLIFSWLLSFHLRFAVLKSKGNVPKWSLRWYTHTFYLSLSLWGGEKKRMAIFLFIKLQSLTYTPIHGARSTPTHGTTCGTLHWLSNRWERLLLHSRCVSECVLAWARAWAKYRKVRTSSFSSSWLYPTTLSLFYSWDDAGFISKCSFTQFHLMAVYIYMYHNTFYFLINFLGWRTFI